MGTPHKYFCMRFYTEIFIPLSSIQKTDRRWYKLYLNLRKLIFHSTTRLYTSCSIPTLTRVSIYVDCVSNTQGGATTRANIEISQYITVFQMLNCTLYIVHTDTHIIQYWDIELRCSFSKSLMFIQPVNIYTLTNHNTVHTSRDTH